MESELPRSHGQHFENDFPQPAPPVEDEQHPEKRSMMGKMKDKARKIKKTLKSYGHGHDNHDYQNSLVEEDVDDDNDDNVLEDEIVKDPKIDGALVHDSTTVVTTQSPPTVESPLGVNKSDMEKLPVLKEDHYASITQEPPIKFEDEKSRGISDDEQVSISNANVEGRGGDLSGNVGRQEEEDTYAPKKDQLFDAQSNNETEVVDSTAKVYDSTTVGATEVPPTVESSLGIDKGDMEKLPVLKQDHYASLTQEPPIKFEEEKSRGISDDEQLPISNANVEGRGGDLSGNVGRKEEEDTNYAPKQDQLFDAQSYNETEVVDSTAKDYDSTTVVTPQTPPTVESALGVDKGDLEKLTVLKEDQYLPVESEEEISTSILDEEHIPISTGVYNEPDNVHERSGAITEGQGWGLSVDVERREEEDTIVPKKDQIFDDSSNFETEDADSSGTGIYGVSQNKPDLGENQQTDSTFGSTVSLETNDGSVNEPNFGANQQIDSTFGSRDELSPRTSDDQPKNSPNLDSSENFGSTRESSDKFSPEIDDETQNNVELNPKQYHDSIVHNHDQISSVSCKDLLNNLHLGTNQNLDNTTGNSDQLSPEPMSSKPSIKYFDTENSVDDLSSYSGMTFPDDLPTTNKVENSAENSAENSVDSAEKDISTDAVTAESFDSKYPTIDTHNASETETYSSPKFAPVSLNEKTEASSEKQYLTENSKPSENEEVHSNIIVDPIPSHDSDKYDQDKFETSEIGTDIVHKPEPEKAETDSSVAEKDSGGNAPTGMVNMIRGKFNSWMGNDNPEQSSQGKNE